MTENKRFYMDKSGDLYDRENETVMIDFGYSYDGVGCKRIIDLLNGLAEENQQLKNFIMDLQSVVQFDVDNGINAYHTKTLLEDLTNALKVIMNDRE